ncbi:radical SAM protein [Candidatus Magnetomorum sp. HK-1]|nr:radical SAM protein [Candidatus Magnetomorum sp. HK-1]
MKDPMLLYSTEEYKNIHKNKCISFPKMLIMQPSSFCNFSCLQCPRQIKVEKRNLTGLGNGYMQPDILQKVSDEFKNEDSFLGVLFALYGEPLMNKHIVDFVKIVKNAGKKVQITTNGFFLSEKLIKLLLSAGLDKIKISFQGTTEKEYSYWRNNSHYQEILKNIDALIDISKEIKPDLYIQIGTSVANDSEKDIANFISYWSKKVNNVYYEATGMLHIQDKDYIQKNSFKHQAIRRTEPCFDIFTRMSVLYNGQVPLCVDDEEHSLGNLYNASIKEIWNGEQFNNNRRLILKNGNILPPCKYCYTSPRKVINEA